MLDVQLCLQPDLILHSNHGLFQLQFFSSDSTHISRRTFSVMKTNHGESLHVKCLSFLPSLTKIVTCQPTVILSARYENPPGGSRSDTCRRTDGQTEITQLVVFACECACALMNQGQPCVSMTAP